MGVGHPVILPSGAAGIIVSKCRDGQVQVELLCRNVVRVPLADLKCYLSQPVKSK